jgi:hypothetical protein
MRLQSIAHTNLHWDRVVGYGPFSLCVIHKEGLCPSSGDFGWIIILCKVNRLYTCCSILAPLKSEE